MSNCSSPLYRPNVRWLCGTERGEDFYASLEDFDGWNGRFWDQRAIWHLEQDDLNLARNYAEKSVAVHRHPFVLTLLGQTLFAMARRDGDGEVLVGGQEALRQARDGFTNWRYWAEDEKPFEIFFEGLLQFRAQWGPMLIPAVVAHRLGLAARNASSSLDAVARDLAVLAAVRASARRASDVQSANLIMVTLAGRQYAGSGALRCTAMVSKA